MAVINRALQRLQGLVWGDGVKDASLYIDGHTTYADVVGPSVHLAALKVRRLDPTTNAPVDLFTVYKDGAVSGTSQPFPVTGYGAVGDGVTDDTAAIRRAIAAACAAGGGTVVFPGGSSTVYLLGASGAGYTLTLCSGLTLQGEGAVLRRASANAETLLGAAVALSDVSLRGLTVDNQSLPLDPSSLFLPNGSSRMMLERVRFVGLAWSGSVTLGTGPVQSSDLRLVDCAFERTLANSTPGNENTDTLQIYDCSRVWIDRCRFESCGAIYVMAANTTACTTAQPMQDIHVTDCVFQRVKTTCVFVVANTGCCYQRVHITGNTATTVGKEIEKGFLSVQGNQTIRGVTVAANVVQDWGYVGSSSIGATANAANALEFGGIDGLVVADNVLDGATAAGTVPAGGNHGIGLLANLTNVACRGNAVRRCGYAGIRLEATAGSASSGVVVAGNTVRECARFDNGALRLGGIWVVDYYTALVIADNVCLDNGIGTSESAGIALCTGASATSIADVLIQGNSCYDTGAGGGAKSQQYGIRVGFTASSASAQPTRISLLDNKVGGTDVAGANEVAGLFYQTTVDLGYVVGINPGADQWITGPTPTFTGFSTNPTVVSRYRRIGNLVVWKLTSGNGTSNQTYFTMTLPVPAREAQGGAGWAIGSDNSVALATPVRIDITTTVATFYTNAAAGVWTNANVKYVQFQMVYEAA